ncbi:MAG: response regulator, partial [Desulfocapsa sp.]|nr:response regulator [Desulfocapsa sp.]
MVAPPPTDFLDDTYPAKDFLESGEKIAIVDDSQEILLLIETLLTKEGFTVLTACNGAELKQILERESIALALLDIGLPDCDGTDLLKEIAPLYPDMSIMMLTGTTNLQIALHCLRQGADDFLVKPVTVDGFNLAVRRVLQKRKLTIQNHRYQKQLEYTNFRTQFLHQLNLKMNNAYLNSTELNTVLQSILVGITAEEGLKFNRAFLLLFNDDRTELQGRFAIGPKFKADATQVWDGIKKDNLHLADILDKVSLSIMDNDTELNAIIQNLKIPADNENHVLIRACESRQSIHVQNGLANSEPISKHLLKCFQEENFVITPLFSPNQSLGVIIADNFVTATPITVDDINSLEIFANQASLAIEHSRSYKDMQNKIVELEEVTQELETNKDLLIETERYSALGHMSAQLVHAIRNPVTSIGGIARLLGKKNSDIKTQKFLDMMIMESSKIESTLDDLFNFVGEDKPDKCLQPLYPLIQK